MWTTLMYRSLALNLASSELLCAIEEPDYVEDRLQKMQSENTAY